MGITKDSNDDATRVTWSYDLSKCQDRHRQQVATVSGVYLFDVSRAVVTSQAQMDWKSKLELEAARLRYQNSTSMDWNPKPLTSKDHGSRQGQSPWQATLAHQAQSGGPQDAFNLFKGAAICMLHSQASRLFCPAPAFAVKRF